MRLALALVALACAGSAAAEPVQDRYGPPRKAPPPHARAYDGRLLGWAGKSAPALPQVEPAQVAARPQPLPPARPPEAAPPPPVRQAAAALPQSLYDAAPPAPAPAPRLAQVQPPPQRGAAPSRLYSLHREYGMAPDAVPAVPSGANYVLIGPPDLPAEAEDGPAPARKPPVDARPF
jgi:Wiskott-Aldrich syndrome protein